jgi:DNA repair exonuclease SbcCD ATPase subunit
MSALRPVETAATPERLNLREAAAILGLTPEGVRKRLLRGQLSAEKDPQGQWIFERSALEAHVAKAASRPGNQTDRPSLVPDVSGAGLITQLQQENARLWEELQRRAAELEQERMHRQQEIQQHAEALREERQSREAEAERRAEELRRKDFMLAEFAHAIAELKARLPELPVGIPPEEEASEAPETPKPSWWRRLLYGPGA